LSTGDPISGQHPSAGCAAAYRQDPTAGAPARSVLRCPSSGQTKRPLHQGLGLSCRARSRRTGNSKVLAMSNGLQS
jgi:hypothetical protein